MADRLPRELRDFISRYIDSVELLEVLGLLRRYPERKWSAREVADVLRSSEGSIDGRLRKLLSQGFLNVSPDSHYEYAPNRKELSDLTAQLIEAYGLYRLRVIEHIYRPADGIEAFADAFRIKKKGDGDG
jgi:hypothetical protein